MLPRSPGPQNTNTSGLLDSIASVAADGRPCGAATKPPLRRGFATRRQRDLGSGGIASKSGASEGSTFCPNDFPSGDASSMILLICAAVSTTTLESQNQKSRTITPPSDPYVLL